MGFTTAIIGRPNVGKSTLFNRMVGWKKSIVDDVSGVTRDRIYGESEWGGKKFNIIDTGGFVANSNEIFEKAIREQVQIAIQEADLILFALDVITGITDLDDEVTKLLRRSKKDVIVVVNKVDNHARNLEATEFYSLGFKETFFISAINGSGTGDLMDAISAKIKKEEEEFEPQIPKIAIIGQPNVGKSSIVNAFIGEERNVVTEIAGTTRDAVHTKFNKFGKELILIDTAGLRKKAKVHENLEFYSTIRSINAIDEADVCILMIDAVEGITQQDLAIFRLARTKSKGIILLVNKWDLVQKETNTARDYEVIIKEKLKPHNDIPILFTSVLEKQRLIKALELAMLVAEKRQTKVTTSVLNNLLEEAVAIKHPPAIKGKLVTIKYVTQIPAQTPTFVFFCNHPKYIDDSYKNFLENFFRKKYDFCGVVINLFFRDKD
ncbi:MAG: ribosome biogenesis GTPase Der [Bacteroidota bacterium]